MLNEGSYRLSFICAVVLHIALLVFLLAKYVSSHSFSLTPAGTFINAVAISERDLDNFAMPKLPQPLIAPELKAAPKPVVIEEKKKDDSEQLKQMLLAESAKEKSLLKKQIQVEKRNLSLKKQKQWQDLAKDQAAQEKQQLQAEQEHGRRVAGEYDKYKAMILQAISSQWIVPDGIDKGASCELLVSVAPGGVVMSIDLIRSSGNEILDRSAQVAVQKASPLPVPKEAIYFDDFRKIKLVVRPEGIASN